MHHGVGRAADGGTHAHCVGECGLGEDLRRTEVFAHHLDDAATGEVREHRTARVDGGDGCVLRQRDSHGLHEARHGRCGTHRVAESLATRHARFRSKEVLAGHLAGADSFRELPHIGSTADVPALVLPVELGAAGQDDRGEVDAGCSHQLGRRVLVASAEQHHAIDWVTSDGLLDGHRHQIPEEHGGWQHLGLAQRHCRENERNSPGLPHTALDVLGQLIEVTVARGQIRPTRADPDHRTIAEQVVRVAVGLHPAAMDEPISIEFAVPPAGAQLRG